MAKKAKEHKVEEKPKYSLEDLAKIVGNLRREKINWDFFVAEQMAVLDDKVIDAIQNTKLYDGVPGALAYALSGALHKAKKDELAMHYVVPALVVRRLTASYVKAIYPDKYAFIGAPIAFTMEMPGIGISNASQMFGYDKKVRNDAVNALDYAVIQKLYSHIMDNRYNYMPAREFAEKFDNVGDDAVRLHQDLADEIWSNK